MRRLTTPGRGWLFPASLAAFVFGALFTFDAHAASLPTSSAGPGQYDLDRICHGSDSPTIRGFG